MNLTERDEYINYLIGLFKDVKAGKPYTIFLTGEAGVGKSSLVGELSRRLQQQTKVYIGACDSLNAPRPLGPLYDIAPQLSDGLLNDLKNESDRSIIFASFLKVLSNAIGPILLIIEDIHWADEATIDFIKFIARRISRLKCLFILTYREDEVPDNHPLKNMFGDLSPESFAKRKIQPLSFRAVDQLAKEKGLESGKRIFELTGGNPFYVTEILANYSEGIPDRVKDSILSAFNRQEESTRKFWELLAISPSRIESNLLKYFDANYAKRLESCMKSGIVIMKNDFVFFKNELFRLAIEESLSAIKKKVLHETLLAIMLEHRDEFTNMSQLVYHARHANRKSVVIEYAPRAAAHASAIGAHIDAATLYVAALEFMDEDDPLLPDIHEKYAYECHLTNQLEIAITSQQKALEGWRAKKETIKEGNAMRFLSRLWWFKGNQEKSMRFALNAVEVLDKGGPTSERALAYSNISQLHMLRDDSDKALYWGTRAIELAEKLQDMEILAHALINVGCIQMKFEMSENEGLSNLKRSLWISLQKGFHEHAARAYANIVSMNVLIRKYSIAQEAIVKGLQYCEEHDLSSWSHMILMWQAKMLLEIGEWTNSEAIVKKLQNHTNNVIKTGALVTLARIRLRQGNYVAARPLIEQAKSLAEPMKEAQRIIPVICTMLELQWLSGDSLFSDRIPEDILNLFPETNNSWYYAELLYWLSKNKIELDHSEPVQLPAPFQFELQQRWEESAKMWREIGCPYEEALALMNLDEANQKKAFQILYKLEALSTYERISFMMRLKGVKKIPRGPRQSTRNNPASLTQREIDVLYGLQEGLRNREIAEKLFISVKTVNHHISSILSKLEVSSRSKAIIEAKRLGILKSQS